MNFIAGKFGVVLLCLLGAAQVVSAQAAGARVLSGVVVTARDELAAGVNVNVTTPAGEVSTVSDAEGGFRLAVPEGALTLRLSGKNVAPVVRHIAAGEAAENLRLLVEY
ncbi:MAG: carboxypeptidase regulatory-like domain-containing protein, partial [Pyrinomonadaceae bacterium]